MAYNNTNNTNNKTKQKTSTRKKVGIFIAILIVLALVASLLAYAFGGFNSMLMTTYRIEAEKGTVVGTSDRIKDEETQKEYLGAFGSDDSATFEIYSTDDASAELLIAITASKSDKNLSDVIKTYVNGVEYEPGYTVVKKDADAAWREVKAGSVTLSEGKNTITFVGTEESCDFDFFSLTVSRSVTLTLIENENKEIRVNGSGGMEIDQEDATPDASPISFSIRTLSRAEFALYDVSPLAESAQVVTATYEGNVSPVLDWTIPFANPSSDWASGKSSSDYITLSVSANTLQATLSCTQAFGEVIQLTATLRGDASVSKTRNVNYVQQLEDATLNVAFASSETPQANFTWTFSKGNSTGNSASDYGDVAYHQSVDFWGYGETGAESKALYDTSSNYTVSMTPTLSTVYTKEATVTDAFIQIEDGKGNPFTTGLNKAMKTISDGISSIGRSYNGTVLSNEITISGFSIYTAFRLDKSNWEKYTAIQLMTVKQALNAYAQSNDFFFYCNTSITVNGKLIGTPYKVSFNPGSFNVQPDFSIGDGDIDFGG